MQWELKRLLLYVHISIYITCVYIYICIYMHYVYQTCTWCTYIIGCIMKRFLAKVKWQFWQSLFLQEAASSLNWTDIRNTVIFARVGWLLLGCAGSGIGLRAVGTSSWVQWRKCVEASWRMIVLCLLTAGQSLRFRLHGSAMVSGRFQKRGQTRWSCCTCWRELPHRSSGIPIVGAPNFRAWGWFRYIADPQPIRWSQHWNQKNISWLRECDSNLSMAISWK
jgi:hypothetical protein